MSNEINTSDDQDISLEKLVAAHLQRYLESAKREGVGGFVEWTNNLEDKHKVVDELKKEEVIAAALNFLDEMNKKRSYDHVRPKLHFREPQDILDIYRNLTIVCILIGMMAAACL